MIAYESLCQAIVDWKAGARPSTSSSAMSTAGVHDGEPQAVEELESGMVEMDEFQADEGEYVEATQDGEHEQAAHSGEHDQPAYSGEHDQAAYSGEHDQAAYSGEHDQAAYSGEHDQPEAASTENDGYDVAVEGDVDDERT